MSSAAHQGNETFGTREWEGMVRVKTERKMELIRPHRADVTQLNGCPSKKNFTVDVLLWCCEQ